MIKLQSGLPPKPVKTPAEAADEMRGKIRDAAKMYEKLFIREMVKAMKQTVPGDGLIKKSQAESIFQDQLDSEYVEKWGDTGGVGLSDLIYDHIVERFGPQMGIASRPQKPQGPIPLQKLSSLSATIRKFSGGVSVSLPKSQIPGEAVEVMSPWPGVLQKYDLMEDGHWLAQIDHDNGLVSKILHSGSRLLSPGERAEAGQKIGLLNPAKDFLWQIQSSPGLAPDNMAKDVSL